MHGEAEVVLGHAPPGFSAPRSALFPHPHSQPSRVRPGAIETSQVACLPGLASVEAYSYKTNEWFFVAPMNTRRSSVGVGVVEGKASVPALAPGPSPGVLALLLPLLRSWVLVS